MNLKETEDSVSRFAAYVEELTSVIGHADRARPLNDYCAGLLVTEGRRSVEPIAAVRGAAARPEETLLIEWPEGEAEPTKYWLATVDEKISFSALVDLAKMRSGGRVGAAITS